MNIQEFGKLIKTKYPQYQSIDDTELGNKMLEKYPTYKNIVDTGKTGFSGFAMGAGKGIINTATNMAQIGSQALGKTAGLLGIKTIGEQPKNIIPQELTTPQSSAERAGFMTEQIAEFFIPGTASTKIGKAAQFATGAGKLGVAARIGATGLTEGLLGTGQSSLQSGKLGASEVGTGAISLVAPAIMEGFGKVATKLIPNQVKTKLVDSINKAIKPSTKSIKTPGYNDAAIKAFKVLDDNQITFNGVKRAPETVSETFDALKAAKQSIYTRYDDIAKQSGEMGAKFTPDRTMADISNWIKNTGYSSDIKEYATKRLQELADLNGASPKLVQDRIKELNSGIKFFTSGSEKLKNQIDASIASRLRQQLDDIIFNTTGQPYQQIKNQYQVLKVIEDDMARTAANLARRGQKGFFDITDIITGADITTGILTANPASIISGTAGRLIKENFKYLNSPDRHIKQIFKLIKKVPSTKSSRIPTQKLLTAGEKGKSSVNVPINLPAKAASTLDAEQVAKFGGKESIWNQIKNNQQGFARFPRIIDDAGRDNLIKQINDINAIDLRTLGTGKYKQVDMDMFGRIETLKKKFYSGKDTPADIIEAKEILARLGKLDNPLDNVKLPKGKGATTPKTALGGLEQEARKYKSAEEFVKAQGKPILHGTTEKFGKFDTSKLGTNEKDLAARNAFFFTDSLDTAKSYGDNVMEAYGNFKKPITIDANGKMYGDMREVINEAVLKAKKDGNDVVIIKNLSDRKDWGNYEPATHYAVIDTNKLQTKSQLTDIWNKANKYKFPKKK